MSLRRALMALLTLVACTLVGIKVASAAAGPFKVLAFYNGTWDAAHIDFDKEARDWFPKAGAQHGFSWEATTDWSRLNSITPSQYQVVMFLDDAPPAAQRSAFQRYMDNGGAWLGFHVSAFTTDANSWSWYYNTFLGSGNFATNTWGPTAETLRLGTHPTTAGLPATIPSAVSEWYSWSRDLRQNPDIDILATVDAASFPVGTDPNQQWRSGHYPLIWSNKKYKMIYTNFGHNAMNYTTNTRTSSTFASAQQNQWLVNALFWLAGSTPDTPPTTTPPATGRQSLVSKNSGKCVDVRAAATANGTAVQQYSCNASTAQQFQLIPTSDGYVRIAPRTNPAQALDVTDVSTADNAAIQLWTYSNGLNQQWQPVAEPDGAVHLVNRNSRKCLDVPAASSADNLQLVQYTCNGTAAQSFRATAVTR